MKTRDVIGVVALISLGMMLPVFLFQAMDLQARIDNREASRAHMARVGR